MAEAESPILASGVGSMPGDGPVEAARLVVGELPVLPHVPELPERGPWADMTGRGAALLLDLPTEYVVGRWSLSARGGRDLRRARSLLDEDLDAVEEVMAGQSRSLKVQVCGPVTLAATLELPGGERAIGDASARKDIAASLAEGIGQHVEQVRRRLPGVDIWVQLDEPALPLVVDGAIPSVSGYRTLEPVALVEVQDLMRSASSAISDGGATSVLHSCATPVAVDLLTSFGVDAIGCPVRDLADDVSRLDHLSRWLDQGGSVMAGVAGQDLTADLKLLRRLMSATGVGPVSDRGKWLLSPECGLVGSTVDEVKSIYRSITKVADQLPDFVKVRD